MEAVSNSTPLIALSRLQKLELLEHFFGTVSIPVEVHDEVVTRGGTLYGAKEVAHAPWISELKVISPLLPQPFRYIPPCIQNYCLK